MRIARKTVKKNEKILRKHNLILYVTIIAIVDKINISVIICNYHIIIEIIQYFCDYKTLLYYKFNTLLYRFTFDERRKFWLFANYIFYFSQWLNPLSPRQCKHKFERCPNYKAASRRRYEQRSCNRLETRYLDIRVFIQIARTRSICMPLIIPAT